MKELPKSEWTIEPSRDEGYIVVDAHENNGYVYFTKLALSDLPNDLLGIRDLERLGIDLINCAAITKTE